MRRTLTVEDYIGNYGPHWRRGVLPEHIDRFVAAGGRTRRSASGSGVVFAITPDGTTAPVVCGDLVQIATEDGPISGRCGANAVRDGACEGHAAESEAWREMSEPERLAWERQHDHDNP